MIDATDMLKQGSATVKSMDLVIHNTNIAGEFMIDCAGFSAAQFLRCNTGQFSLTRLHVEHHSL
jgi:hypothetical protein